LTSSGFSSLSLSLLSRVFHSVAVAALSFLQDPNQQLPLLQFSPLRRFPNNGQLLTPEGYQPSGYVAFSAFLTLSRLSSARRLPALFHAGPALGVLPSRVVFVCRVFHPFGFLFPLVVSVPFGLPHFRVLIPAYAVLPLRILRGRTQPSWAFSSLGVFTLRQ
jgi:hypothetical protein